MPQKPSWRRLHGAADVGVALAQDVDEGLAVERQHQGAAQVGDCRTAARRG